MTRCLILFDGHASQGPYGIDKLQELGYELLEVEPARHRLHVKVRDVMEHRTGRPLDKTIRSVPKAGSADIVFAFLERQALTASWLKMRRIPPYSSKPLAMMACWLADELRGMPADDRRTAAKQYAGVDLTMVWSTNQIEILVDAGFSPEQVEAIPFGFAPELYPVVDPTTRDGSLAAIGSDRGRDYPTLLEAMRQVDHELHLYCKEGNLQGRALPRTVRFHGTVPYEEYQRLLRSVAVVAIPTRELAYPTGQTVALEAAGTGAAVVLTDTPAMREYFSEETAVMVAPGDVDGWQRALTVLARDPERRAALGLRAADHVHTRFTYLQMWERVHHLFRERGWVR